MPEQSWRTGHTQQIKLNVSISCKAHAGGGVGVAWGGVDTDTNGDTSFSL